MDEGELGPGRTWAPATAFGALAVAVVTVLLVKGVGPRRPAVAESDRDPFDRSGPARRPPRPPSCGYRKRRRPRR